MRWQTPELFEVKMDAEIGSYQVDDERDGMPTFAVPAIELDVDADATR